MGKLLNIHFELGIITSPRLSGTEITQWLEHHQEAGHVANFTPQLKGKAAVQLFGEMPDLGTFNHLDPTTDWDNGIELTKIHQNFGVKSYGDHFVVVLKADFNYSTLED